MANKENAEIIAAMEKLKQENNKENLTALMQLLEKGNLYVPAVLPPDTDPALIKEIAASVGKQQPIPKGLSPKPAILENNNGEKFLPLFTSEEEAVKGGNRAPLILGLPFKACMDLIAKEPAIKGVVLNAFNQNVVLNTRVNRNDGKKKEVKLTEEQLHAVLRQQVEANLLPAALFENPTETMKEIAKREGEVFLEFYREAYPENVICPYTAEDFEVMHLNIRDDLEILRLTMPVSHQDPGACLMILVSWNPLEEKLRYFGILKAPQGQENRVVEALADGKKLDHGVAPAEGSELQFLIDMNE